LLGVGENLEIRLEDDLGGERWCVDVNHLQEQAEVGEEAA
jgi:hypothetical protein